MSTDSAIESSIKLKSELEKPFHGYLSAESVEKILESFENMESASFFTHSELAEYCWSIVKIFLRINQFHKPKQVIEFAHTAMTILRNNNNQISIPCFGTLSCKVNIGNTCSHGSYFFVACVCYVFAAAFQELNMYGMSLRYLNLADYRLSELEKDENSRCLKNCARQVWISIQHKLYDAKVAMGRKDEAVVQARKWLELMELMMDGNSFELYKAYLATYVAYRDNLDAERALPFCQKALDICIRCLGEYSTYVPRLRFDLAVLYNVVGESNKAAHERKLAQSAMEISDFEKASFRCATFLFNFGNYKDVIDVLEVVVKCNGMEAHRRVFAFLTMAKAYGKLGKFVDAGKYMTDAESILQRNVDVISFGTTYLNMSDMYEAMNEFGRAISLLKGVRVMSMHQQEIDTEGGRKLYYQNLLAAICTRLFKLISRPGTAKEEKQFMIDVAEKLEQTVGIEHIEVGYSCSKFGDSLLISGQADLALKVIKKAKDILEFALGPHHVKSLKTSHHLSEIYMILKRYNEAVSLQVKVVEETKGLGPSEKEFKDKAVGLLNSLKKIVATFPTSASPQSQDSKDLSSEK